MIYYYEILKTELETLKELYPDHPFIVEGDITKLPLSVDGLWNVFSAYRPLFIPVELNIRPFQITREQAFQLVHSDKYIDNE